MEQSIETYEISVDDCVVEFFLDYATAAFYLGFCTEHNAGHKWFVRPGIGLTDLESFAYHFILAVDHYCCNTSSTASYLTALFHISFYKYAHAVDFTNHPINMTLWEKRNRTL